MVLCCRSESDIPVAAPVIAGETGPLEQSASKIEEQDTLPSEEQQQGGDSDSAAGVENTSFSVDELTTRLRKSLTLNDQPENEVLAAVEQETVGIDLDSDTAKTSLAEPPADESCTFFDCENKSFDENNLPNTLVEPTADIGDSHLGEECEADVCEDQQIGETDDTPDTEPREVVETMADNLDLPRSPPIAATKGSYAINWDEVDEDSDPFMPKKQLSNSPPKSPVLPACVGAGDGTSLGEVDPFKPSRRLTDSPPGTVDAGEGSSMKQSQRRSINNNLPEPVSDGIGSEPSDELSCVNESMIVPVTDGIVSNPVDMVAPVTDGIASQSSEEVSCVADSSASEPADKVTPVTDGMVSDPAKLVVSGSDSIASDVTDMVVPVTDGNVSDPVDNVAPVVDSIGSELADKVAPTTGGIASDPVNELAPVTDGIASELADKVGPATDGIVSDSVGELAPVTDGIASELADKVAPTTGGIVSDSVHELAPVTDGIVSDAANMVVHINDGIASETMAKTSLPTDSISIDSRNNTPSMDDDKQSEVVQSSSPTEHLDAAE